MIPFLETVRGSLPGKRIVHGVKITKAPIGRYLAVMATLEELPGQMLDACFPGQPVTNVLTLLATSDNNVITAALGRLLTAAPKPLLEALCDILDMPTAELNRLTPKEFLDVWTAFWEVNDMSGFFTALRPLLAGLMGSVTAFKD